LNFPRAPRCKIGPTAFILTENGLKWTSLDLSDHFSIALKHRMLYINCRHVLETHWNASCESLRQIHCDLGFKQFDAISTPQGPIVYRKITLTRQAVDGQEDSFQIRQGPPESGQYVMYKCKLQRESVARRTVKQL
jgi:hypothetical protein